MKKNNSILIATSNSGKIKEFKKIFSEYKVLSNLDFSYEDPIEDGLSFEANAKIKALNAFQKTGLITIADDSGLVVPDLDYEPGILSARYAVSNATYKDNRDKIIEKIKCQKKNLLHAYYECFLVCIFNIKNIIITSGRCKGYVSVDSSGDGGFGYDKIFYPEGFNCSMASLDSETKNKISHRGQATKKLIEKFNKTKHK